MVGSNLAVQAEVQEVVEEGVLLYRLVYVR